MTVQVPRIGLCYRSDKRIDMIVVMKQNERSRIDSDLLQTFLIVAEARNITRAAE
jgi:hypothetical protein